MEWYTLEVGIEHLMTGICFHPVDTSSFTGLQFTRKSPSIMQVRSDKPFTAYWPVKGITLYSQVTTLPNDEPRYSEGEAEWFAQVMGRTMQQTDTGAAEEWNLAEQHRTGREVPALPDVVIAAMRRKHGAQADEYIRQLRYSSGDKFWHYTYAGMFIGIEPDGYMHT